MTQVYTTETAKCMQLATSSTTQNRNHHNEVTNHDMVQIQTMTAKHPRMMRTLNPQAMIQTRQAPRPDNTTSPHAQCYWQVLLPLGESEGTVVAEASSVLCAEYFANWLSCTVEGYGLGPMD